MFLFQEEEMMGPNVTRCVGSGSLISLLPREGETLGIGRHWVGTNTGQIEVYKMVLRGLAGIESCIGGIDLSIEGERASFNALYL
jgi:hypothetical protein